MPTRILLPLLAAVLTPLGLAAQDVPSPYRFVDHGMGLEGYVGYLDMDRGEVGVGPGPGIVVGGRFTFDAADPLTMEGGLYYVSSERDVLNPARDPGDLRIGEADVHLLGLEAALRFNPVGRRTWHRLQPFLLAGGGLAVDVASESPLEADFQSGDVYDFGTSFTARIGGGALWFHSQRWAVRGEATLALWKVETPGGFLRSDRPFSGVPEEEWTGGLQVSLGLTYRF